MPLAGTGDILGDAIRAAIDATPDKTDRSAIFRAIGNAIVAHIIANGVVAVASVTGVTPGGGVSGPGTGTIT